MSETSIEPLPLPPADSQADPRLIYRGGLVTPAPPWIGYHRREFPDGTFGVWRAVAGGANPAAAKTDLVLQLAREAGRGEFVICRRGVDPNASGGRGEYQSGRLLETTR